LAVLERSRDFGCSACLETETSRPIPHPWKKFTPESLNNALFFTYTPIFSIQFCNIVWGICCTTVFNSLFCLAEKTLYAITILKWNAYTAPLFHELHILPLCHLNDFQVGCFMYRCINALLPKHFCNMLTKNMDFYSYETRNRHCMHMTACRLTLRKYSINDLFS